MTLEIRSYVPRASELPPKQTIFIGGRDCGECEPMRNAGGIRWHAVIRLEEMVGSHLVQGFGDSPEKAVTDGVIRMRKELATLAERMKWLESNLGTADKTSDELRASLTDEADAEPEPVEVLALVDVDASRPAGIGA